MKYVVVAPDGGLWVQRYTFEGETPATDVFDAAEVATSAP